MTLNKENIQEDNGNISTFHQDWLTLAEQNHRIDEDINSEVIYILQILRNNQTNNTNHTIGSSTHIQDIHSMIQPPSQEAIAISEENEEESKMDDFSPRRNTPRRSTQHVNYTSKNYALL